MKNCGRCGQHANNYLCEHCSSTTIRALTLLAPIVADLRSMMTDLHTSASDDVRVDGSREQRLGADFDLSDRAHGLYALVANWVVGWALALPTSTAPGYLSEYSAANVVTGLPQGTPAFSAAARLSNWLISHHDEIAEYPEAGLYAIGLSDAITDEAMSIGYRPRPRRVPEKLCRVCDSPTLRHSWPLGGEPRLNCTACGEESPCGPNLTRAVLARR